MSWDSFAAEGGVDDPPVGVGVVDEERDSEEAEGEATWEGADSVLPAGCLDVELAVDVAGAADERPAPLPSTLPPPIVRLDMAWSGSHEEGRGDLLCVGQHAARGVWA
jgi:hypothetical protein